MVHLHARDPETQKPDYRKELFARIIHGIRGFAPDLVVCVSTSGRTYNELAKRAEVLSLDGDLKPDMASLTLSSLNFNAQASINDPQMIQDLARLMQERGIRPELEAFDAGMVHYSKYLAKKGLVGPPYYFNLILGNIACAQADLLHVGVLANDVPEGALCAFGGVGAAQLPVNAMAVAFGYGVRVGLEDNIWHDAARTRLSTNVGLVRRVHALAEANGRPVMTPAELRARLGLRPGNGAYGIAGDPT